MERLFFLQRCLFIVATISWPYGISLVAKNIMSGLPIKIRMTENFHPIFLINILRTNVVSTLWIFIAFILKNPYLVIWSY